MLNRHLNRVILIMPGCLKDIHKKYGNIPLKDFLLCSEMLKNRIYYQMPKRMRVVKSLDYIKYNKDKTIQF